ncbi:MAG: DUF4912 domain-containing protein, partial [Candidatus Omnitrophica bacterium]|nr:DUF4912 domain-containing protein [Candidatus Omnitrophota bacterium]
PKRKAPARRKPQETFSINEDKKALKKPIPAVDRKIFGRKPFIDNYDLLSHYGTTHLTLMVKDPFWIYTYWELANQKEDMGNAKIVLRMHDVTLIDFNGSNSNHYFDIEVGPHSNNWYINLLKDGVSYIGEIGLRMSDGGFFVLARSNCVQTPRMNYSPRSEQIWMEVKNNGDMARYAISKVDFSKAGHKSMKNGKRLPAKRRIIYLTERDIRSYYSGISPMLRDIISSRLTSIYGQKISRQGFVIEGGSEEERQRILSSLPKGHFIKKIRSGASEELFVIGGGEHSAGASESMEKGKGQRRFFFELATELIVYGRTESDAELWLGGKKVELNKDGTFSMRLALPDGKVPLEFTAISKDKKEYRKINTYVERNTNHTSG